MLHNESGDRENKDLDMVLPHEEEPD